MSLTDTVVPAIEIALAIFMGIICFYGLYKLLQYLKFWDWLRKKRSKKPMRSIYEDVARALAEGKDIGGIMEGITHKPLKIQRQYIDVYLEFKALKGGERKE